MSNDVVLARLHEAVDELTRSRIHHEPHTVRQDGSWKTLRHRTDVPSLLEQLEAAVEPGGTGDHGQGKPGSRPAARLEAVDTLLRIDAAAHLWLTVRLHRPTRATTALNIQALLGLAGELNDVQQWDLTADVRRWVTWARVTTGWEVPAFKPDNTCPLCGTRGGLRVRAGDGVTSQETQAMCVDCGEHWDPDSIGLLAAHIRAENDDEQGVA